MTKPTKASKEPTVMGLPHGGMDAEHGQGGRHVFSMSPVAQVTATYVTVTPELIEAGASSGVGFTVAQMRALGEGPRKGWRRRAIGKLITRDAAMTFLFDARRSSRRPLPGSPDHRRALAALERAAVPRRERERDALEEILVVAADVACPACGGEQMAGPSVDAAGRTTERQPCQLCAPRRERIVTEPRVVRDIGSNPTRSPPWL
jgi:hypothetical protein